MELSVRPSPYRLPSYSLTGDLLNFERCGLQYRYYNVGKLPSLNPVQLWFGQFIHGVMEEAYRRYIEDIHKTLPPWNSEKIDEIIKLVSDRLALRGLLPWNKIVEQTGNQRAEIAINELGKDLFPLIKFAEVRLTGARDLEFNSKNRFREVDKYEIKGVVDVITDVNLNDPQLKHNKIIKVIKSSFNINQLSNFEIIVDYKGMRRPPNKNNSKTDNKYWEQYEWQIQTYSHLRKKQTKTDIKFGLLIYINELLPSATDMIELKKEIKNKLTDVIPIKGSKEEKLINEWKRNTPLPILPYEFKLKRALRIIEINDESINNALKSFDKTVQRIETCISKEKKTADIINSWEKNGTDESTCTACDVRTFCPVSCVKVKPKLPGVR